MSSKGRIEFATEITEDTEVMSDALTEAIISAAIEVHRVLGPGLLESIKRKHCLMSFNYAERLLVGKLKRM